MLQAKCWLVWGLGIAVLEITGCQAVLTDTGNFCSEPKIKLCGQELNLVNLCQITALL